MTEKEKAAVEACVNAAKSEGLRAWTETSSLRAERQIVADCQRAGRAVIAERTPEPRYWVDKYAGSSKVRDRKSGDAAWLAEFCGPGNVAYAEAHAAHLNGANEP